ncbi:related to Clustered mitochondria protein homolog [Saccharomycodes ludwigii]|uniref:Related to Clustered mitochondria protein homolog n=1 Tax=Saccharomycodes ludwigii TaxID=36035 RepID=A0A376B719_9ASCO|nr:hypothetical protein SCDLUD_004209 [Saccharomycodes ludwigii]KAH3899902.1 hypothetical protein SCDLUD_004209 [Saccharomycodes ludwigii]SSD60473.1 related to Clustered mitochondria protein homolog [Saccharomycodes ludwigii]
MSDSDTTVKVIFKLPLSLASKDNNKIEYDVSRESIVTNIADLLRFTPQCKFITNYTLLYNGKEVDFLKSFKDLHETSKEYVLHLQLSHYTTASAISHFLSFRSSIGLLSESVDGISEFAISGGATFDDLKLKDIKPAKAQQEKEVTKEDSKEGAKEGAKENTKEDANEEKAQEFQISEEEKKEVVDIIAEILDKDAKPGISKVLAYKNNFIAPCVRSLTISNYNPVPSFYKCRGHTLYLQVVTLEGEVFHITGDSAGFYVNKSSSNKFDPSPKDEFRGITLYDVISHHSKKFISHVNDLEKKISTLDLAYYSPVTTTFLNKPWFVSQPNIVGDYTTLQMPAIEGLQQDRDLSNEFQSVRDEPVSTFHDRVSSEKLLAKIAHDFNVAAVTGAMKVINGELTPLNIDSSFAETEAAKTYYHHNIFYSYVSDYMDEHKEEGGSEYVSASTNADLNTIKILHRLGSQEIRYLLTTIVDYCGRRILCQATVPGLLEIMGVNPEAKPKEDEEKENFDSRYANDIVVIYGSNDETGEIAYNEKFNKNLNALSQYFHLKPHTVDGKEFFVSSKTKGLVGSDKRNYIMDLYGFQPLDYKFISEYFDGVSDPNQRYPHRNAFIRHELVNKWWNEKVETTKLDLSKAFEEKEFSFNPDDEKDPVSKEISEYLTGKVIPQLFKNILEQLVTLPFDGEQLTDIFHKSGVNMRYLGAFLKLVEDELEKEVKDHEKKKAELVERNVEYKEYEKNRLIKIEKLIKERREEINKYVMEGKDVPEELTKNLNLDDADIRKPNTEEPHIVNYDNLNFLRFIIQLEVVSRSLKHILKNKSFGLPVTTVPALISYVFNLLFGNQYNTQPELQILDPAYAEDKEIISSISGLTRESIIKQIQHEASIRFHCTISDDWFDKELATRNQFNLIRSICMKFGIQLFNKSYYFTKEQFENYKESLDKKTRNKLQPPLQTFSTSDFTVRPVIKDSDYVSTFADELWNAGAIQLSENQEEAFSLISRSIAVKEQVNGSIHASVGENYLTLSFFYSKQGKIQEAIAFARQASIILERTTGVDSFVTLKALTNLAILEFSNESAYNCVKLISRILNILEASVGYDCHPSILSILETLQRLALRCKELNLTVKIVEKVNDLIVKIQNGFKGTAYAMNLSTLGNLYATFQDYTNSLKCIEEAHKIYSDELGLDHNLTLTATQWLNSLNGIVASQKLARTQAAVNAAPRGTQANSSNSGAKKNGKSNKKKLVGKSIEELVEFVEGGEPKKSNKGGNKH